MQFQNHFRGKFIILLTLNCRKDKPNLQRLLVIHSQASHGCALSMTIIGSSIDFSDDSLFLVKSFFPSLTSQLVILISQNMKQNSDATDPNCEPELVRMDICRIF